MIKDAYGFLCGSSFDLKATTVQHLEEQFRDETGATGATIERCINFFKAVANEAGIELSPHLSKRRPRRPRTSSNGPSRKGKKKNTDEAAAAPAPPSPANSRTVKLRSGAGEITLSYDVDLFEMDSEDQQFLLGLIAKMKDYEDAADG